MNLNRLAFNNIRRRKLRSVLTMLGIIIGVATIVVLVGATAGATTALKEETNEYMYDIIISPSVSSGSYLMDSQTVAKVNKLSQIYDLKELTTFQEYIGADVVTIVGTTDWKSVKIKKGSSGVVIDESLANKGHGIGSKIKIKNQELTITGITDADGSPLYLDQVTAKKIAGDKVSAISARTKGDPKTVAKQVRKQVDGIQEEDLEDLNDLVDAYGIGTTISNAPVVDFSMDIVEINGEPLAKRGKCSGAKEVLRCEECQNTLVVPFEKEISQCYCGAPYRTLIHPLIENNKILKELPNPETIRKYVIHQIKDI